MQRAPGLLHSGLPVSAPNLTTLLPWLGRGSCCVAGTCLGVCELLTNLPACPLSLRHPAMRPCGTAHLGGAIWTRNVCSWRAVQTAGASPSLTQFTRASWRSMRSSNRSCTPCWTCCCPAWCWPCPAAAAVATAAAAGRQRRATRHPPRRPAWGSAGAAQLGGRQQGVASAVLSAESEMPSYVNYMHACISLGRQKAEQGLAGGRDNRWAE